MKKKILKKADKMINMITSLEEYKCYKKAYHKLEKNEGVKKLLDEKRRLQQNIINLEHFNKERAKQEYEKKLLLIEKKLKKNPLYQEYKRCHEELDDIAQEIIQIIENNINTF
ncbi:MAG TPA: YlbF family regulator [Tenericutes bacterium]|nr:YlbF family regulator [Mycoplasmatota bacterium]